METKRLIIKDKKRKEKLLIDTTHPLYSTIKNSMMPDEYREKMSENTHYYEDEVEENINLYYKSITTPYYDVEISKPFYLFWPLAPQYITAYPAFPDRYLEE